VKVNLKDKEIQQYVLSVEIEHEGETYRADLDYSIYDGYEVTFLNDKGAPIGYPEWAKDVENGMINDSLGYWLENQIGGWFEWASERIAEVGE
jgi:hypothetical protein